MDSVLFFDVRKSINMDGASVSQLYHIVPLFKIGLTYNYKSTPYSPYSHLSAEPPLPQVMGKQFFFLFFL